MLNEIQAHLQTRRILYWRDKRGHEVDFVMIMGNNPIAIECKWSASEFEPANLKSFRRQYPEGDIFVVASDVGRSFHRTYDDVVVRYVSLQDLISVL